jgi:hypothetical protein
MLLCIEVCEIFIFIESGRALILHVLDGVYTDLVAMDSNVKFSAIQLPNVNRTHVEGSL